MKLGLAGTTIIYSSGDNGVAGNSAQCCTKAKCAGGTYNSGTGGTFNPSFPSTCPYVTSVGATQIVPGASVTAPEEACETVIYSGGGFSNVFAQPSYQASAVVTYYSTAKPSYSATQYNNSQHVRSYPDVAANGANYVVAVDGSLTLVYGTSASAPVFGSIITLINEARVAAGKSAVGFINPTIYANPSAFNDIVSGTNQGCGTKGFTAVKGWDPVTGLGTPNAGKLKSVFLALP
jgi:tripeptidyl-peptidase-1